MPEKGNVFKVSIRIPEGDQRDIVLFHIDAAGALAVEEEKAGLVIYGESQSNLESISSYLMDKDLIKSDDLTFDTLEKINWNAEWEKNFDPVQIDLFCRVRAPFHSKIAGVKYDIVVNPAMAFGTGHHETTAMMIEAMSKIQFKHKKTLDFGCGTAVLSILAEQMGSQRITACDIDEHAILSAKNNLEINGCQKISLIHGGLDQVDVDLNDVILANINRNVLIASVEEIRNRMNSHGQLLISGILEPDASTIESLYTSRGFKVLDKMNKGDWVCFRMKVAS